MTVKQCPDILRWSPTTWDLFLGNEHIKRLLQRTLRILRRQIASARPLDQNRLPLLFSGPSRSGKTALVKFFMRCLACRQLDPDSLNPCQSCSYCQSEIERHGVEDAGHLILGGNSDDTWFWAAHAVQFIPIDCTRIYTPTELRSRIDSVAQYEGAGDLVVVHLDEVHRLVARSMDEILLKAVEEMSLIWILSTAKPMALEGMLKNRLLKFATELPTEEQLSVWLSNRCTDWGIYWEPEAIVRVVQKSNCVVGTALHALALASVDPEEGLTLDLVDNDWLLEMEE